MDEWTPIKLAGEPAISEEHGQIIVRQRLEPPPTSDWKHVFDRPPNVSQPMGLMPSMSGSTIEFRVPVGHLKTYLQALPARVEATNAYYVSSVIPRIEADARARAEEKEARAARLAQAQRIVDELRSESETAA